MKLLPIILALTVVGCSFGVKHTLECEPTTASEPIAGEVVAVEVTKPTTVNCVGLMPTKESRNFSVYLVKKDGDKYQPRDSDGWIDAKVFKEVNCLG